MKIIFGVDAIFPPLTGIGRYAWELAQRICQDKVIEDATYFSHGRFVDNPTIDNNQTHSSIENTIEHTTLSSIVRARLARLNTLVKLYGAITPHIYQWRLRNHKDYLFHSPNYFLPNFEGPSIATVHDLSTVIYPNFHPVARVCFMNSELPKTINRADHLITDSEYIRNQIIEYFSVAPSRVTAISLGVDIMYHPRRHEETENILAQYGLTHGSYCLCVATIEPRKNIEKLIEAHQSLPDSLKEKYPLVLIGSAGWNSEHIHKKIKSLIGPSLFYLQYIPQFHLYSVYSGAILFTFLSIYEGFGLPVLEAMASGIPCLISEGTCLPEVAGDAALKVNPLDVDAIREKITQALHDEKWRTKAATAGLKRSAEYSWDHCYIQTRKLYEKYTT